MTAQVTPKEEDESFAAHVAIAATLQRYVEAARAGDGGLMLHAFAAGARVCGTYSGKPAEWNVREFCEIIDKGGPAVDLEAQIVVIECTGNAAMARLEARNWRGTRYTDFFVLTEQDGAWRINSKVFFAHARA
jgi:hypothetical protein